jgi:serine/threonine protein kinase
MTHHPNLLPLGTQLQEYVIEDILGVGTFGITYKAMDTHLGISVVIKEYLPEAFARRENDDCVAAMSTDTAEIFAWGREHFLEEAKILAKFRHPNIVRVTRYFLANDTAYFVMDFEDGECLQSKLQQNDEPLDEAVIIPLFTQILNGLNVVHQQKYLHRDIKPGNIFIRKDNSAMLIDFGSARHDMPGDGSTTVLVTPGYAPVELYISESNKGPWTDLYSVGATIYRCLTKDAPPISIERLKKLEDFSVDPRPNLAKDMPHLGSKSLLESVDWMLSIAAEARPQNVQEVLDMWAGKHRSSGTVRQLPVESKKNQNRYKILIAGSAGAGIPTALQTLGDATATGVEKNSPTSSPDISSQTARTGFASLDISSQDSIQLYSIPAQEQLKVAWDTLQDGAKGLVLLLDSSNKRALEEMDSCMQSHEGFINRTGLVIGIYRSAQQTRPNIHDYHGHLAKTKRNWKVPPPILEVDPGNRREMKKLLLALLFHLNPGR